MNVAFPRLLLMLMPFPPRAEIVTPLKNEVASSSVIRIPSPVKFLIVVPPVTRNSPELLVPGFSDQNPVATATVDVE